jgi:alpha-2-macroglobulin
MKSAKSLGALLLLLLFCFACNTGKDRAEARSGPSGVPEEQEVKALQIVLSEGKEVDPSAAERPMTKGTPLSQSRIDELLKMFTEPLEEEKDKPGFLKRPSSKPAPRSVTPKEIPFPPADGDKPPPDVQGQALEVLSVSPEGELERAPRLSISFNQPMIAVSDPTADEQGDPLGIKIEPRPEGKWRWLGTQTVIFEPKGAEFPRATEYKVTVPAGIADVNGSKLTEAVTQTFKLPRPKVEQFYPQTSGLDLDPLLYFVFDQPVDPEQTLKLIHLREGSQEVALEQLTVAEAEKMQTGVKSRFKDALDNRVFYYRPKRSLKPGTSYTMVVEKGIKSAEGPLLSLHDQTSSFSTYYPLTLSSRHPQEGEEVSPFSEFYLHFNNELDPEKFDESFIKVSPEIENFKVRVQGSSLYLGGIKSGNTTYTVTVNPKLTDVFKQTLGKTLTLQMKTGRAPKALSHGFSAFTVLDPTVKAGLPIYTTNIDELDMEVYQVSPDEWTEYLGYLYQHQSAYTPEDRKKLRVPGKRVAQNSLKIKGEADKLVSTRVDISEYLDDNEGNLIVWVKDPTEDKENYRQREFVTWVQGTKLGLDLEVGPGNVVALATSLADGKPLKGAAVTMRAASGKTDEKGVVVFDAPSTQAPICLVEANGSQAFIPYHLNSYDKDSGWHQRSLGSDDRWFIFDDRGLYKPGEKARVKGYARAWQRGPKGQLTNDGQADSVLSWTMNDPRGNKVAEGTTTLNAFSAFELEVEFGPDTNLGDHQLIISGPGLPTGYHSLNVQEFRRPEFEVSTTVLTEEPHLLLGSATVEAKASYYAGGALSNSDVYWTVNSTPSSFTPPGRSDYTFGEWSPWWNMGCWWIPRPSAGGSYLNFEGKTDGEGAHLLGMDFVEMSPPKPTTVSVTASVADVNRQQQASSSSILVHPSERYVGMKAEKSFVDEKSSFEFELIVTDIDGNLLPGINADVQLLLVEYEYSRTKGYHEKETQVDLKKITSSETSSKITFDPDKGGTYRIKAFVRDDKDRLNQTEYTFWKAGGELPSKDKVELEDLTVIPDKKEYKPGDTARLLVMAPFQEGEGVVVWDRDGFSHQERFTLKNGTATLEQPLTEEMIPNLHANITCVGQAKWGKRERPAVAGADLDLSITTESRKLIIDIEPAKQKVEPGATVDVPVTVKDFNGKAVSGSEVTLWVVDEAVLGLTGYSTPAPMGSFYGHRPNQMSPYHNRTYIALADPEMAADPEMDMEMAEAEEGMAMSQSLAPGAAPMRSRSVGRAKKSKELGLVADEISSGEFKGGKNSEPQTFAVRENFDAMAIFRGDLNTDVEGRTSVKVKLPDNLTRYRIMAVAVKDGDKFGHADEVLTARLPVMVRPSLPRFLNFGDKASLPVVIQNQTDEPLDVDIVGQATGITWLGAAGQSVKVPANDRVEVMFEAQADAVGRAHFRFGAVSGGFSDAATLSLPVYTPASGEAFATYGNIGEDGAIKQPVRRPGDVWPQFGGLDVSLSSTALSELTDAFLYLYQYPFECAEQKSSRILAVAALREVLSAFNPDMMPSSADIEAQMKKDILHLERLQNSDGGFEYWRRDEDSDPFCSVHVIHALARARVEKYAVNDDTMERGLEYLRDIEARCRAKNYGEYTTRTLTAYALYVRNLVGDQDVAKAKSLLPHFTTEKYPNLEAIGWIWPTLSQHAKDSAELKEIRRYIKNRATQTADKAQFSASYGEGDGAYLLLYSSRRTDAILLGSLLTDEPKNPLNTKLVRGLLAHRKKGRWNNTQENIWILLALQSYFREYEKETPNFMASLWLDSTFLGEEAFKGRSNKEAQLHVPMADVSEDKADLIVQKQGAGRLYYRIGMKYAPKSLRLPAENRGFLVERAYKGMDDEGDVKQLENGDWEVKAGAKIEVTLTMVAPERRYHVALVDQLPAGLEPLNPALKGTAPVNTGGTVEQSRGWYGWYWRWYEHENLRDERVEAFASLVYPGVYTYTYTALATTPGEYVLPPLKAEEMYSPEVFGRTATGRFVVK